MDSQILKKAKSDIPLYFTEFKAFWDSTTAEYTDKELIDCYATSTLFKNWSICLNHVAVRNLTGLLNELHEDINASFFHSYFGHYRSAHMHLRSVIELALQLLYFYQHEVEYIQWRNADFRIKHEELTAYLKKHPNLSTPSLTNLINEITSMWKTFSKHIHGENPAYFQSTLASARNKKINKADFGIWKSSYLKTGYRINKLLLVFFQVHVNRFPTQSKDILLRNMKKKDLVELGIGS